MDTQALEGMLARGVDNALLRFGLGKGYLDAGDAAAAVGHLRQCVALDPQYSAAWKLLGKAHVAAGEPAAARAAWESGLAVAQAKGDRQAEKEMTVFMRRLDKAGN